MESLLRHVLTCLQIVDRHSASLGLGTDRETTIALDLDHHNICKFDSQTDHAYEHVADNIVDMVQEAIAHAPPSGLASPASPDTSITPLESPPLLLSQVPSSGQGLGLLHAEPSMSALSLADTVEQRPASIISDSSENIDRRYSNAAPSTAFTSDTSIDGRSIHSQATAMASPRLAGSIKMNLKDSQGKNLRAAAAEGKKDIVKRMLEQGAPIDNSGVWDGYTALAEAAVNGQESIVELLLKEGADPAFKCISTGKKFGRKQNTPLSLAAGKGHLGCIRLLLDAHQYSTQDLNDAYRAAKYKTRSDAIKLIQENGGGLY